MSLHTSLKRNRLGQKRSVLNRVERVKFWIEKGKWKEGDKVLGLPKVKVIKLKALKKEKPEEKEANNG